MVWSFSSTALFSQVRYPNFLHTTTFYSWLKETHKKMFIFFSISINQNPINFLPKTIPYDTIFLSFSSKYIVTIFMNLCNDTVFKPTKKYFIFITAFYRCLYFIYYNASPCKAVFLYPNKHTDILEIWS